MSYSIRPEEHELREARKAVEGALESCKYVLEKDVMLEVNLGSFSSPGDFGASGAALSSDRAQFSFDSEKKAWKEDIQKVATKEYGKSWFYEKTDPSDLLWREILADCLGLIFIENTTEGKKPEKDPEAFKDEWNELKPLLAESLSEASPEDFSWQLKWFIGEKLAENHSLESFPEVKKSDIEEIGGKVFK